uniref:Uncharacterized protein n=1 Tax=Panagrolaimus davidi TaxID=227884 RepID=A0A914PJR1_9BILA
MPDFLGTKSDFDINYAIVIENGKVRDATPQAVIDMVNACNVLYNAVEDFVHRKSAKVLINEIDIEKHEFTVMLRPTDRQIEMIEAFLNEPGKLALVDRYPMTYILNHPAIYHAAEHPEFYDQQYYNVELSNKTAIFLDLLRYCETVGDKLLLFTFSLHTLDYIENVLQEFSSNWFNDGHVAVANTGNNRWGWRKGMDYWRIDGKTASNDRSDIEQFFNERPQLRLMLFSTIAGI